MSKAELFDVLKEQLFDRLVNFNALRKEIYLKANGTDFAELGKNWPDFARECASSLVQIATASRLERYEYQETLTENIKALRNNPKAFEVVTNSRDQSILIEFFARVLSILYYETIIEGIMEAPKDTTVLQDYAAQIHELSEIILFVLGKELQIDDEYLQIMVEIGKLNFETTIYEDLEKLSSGRKTKNKEFILERKIKSLRYKGVLYKNSYSKILNLAKDDFWWDDQVLKYYINNKAEQYFSEAQEILQKNPLDPTLLLTIDFDIAVCKGRAKSALGSYYLEFAINSLMNNNHQQAYDYFMLANRDFNASLEELQQLPVESSTTQELIEEVKANIEFTEIFTTLVALSCSIIELSSQDFPQKELIARIKSLVSLSEAPLLNVEFYNQSEFLNTVGFILENLKILSDHEKLTANRLEAEIKKGFHRLCVIFNGRIDNISRSFLQLPWDDDQKDLEIKKAFCESETIKTQDILISILLMPIYVTDRNMLVAKSKAVLNILNSETNRLKGFKEKNTTKALCMLVKSFNGSNEAFNNLEEGNVIEELKSFVKDEFSKTFVQSHLKETSILQTGNQYFFARYLLRTLPDILATMDLNKVPKDIASLIIEHHGSMFESMITIWERLSSHYEAILKHKKKYQVTSEDIINWTYIEKKREHTKGAMYFFKSCQAIIMAQEYAQIKERAKAEKLFNNADNWARKSAELFGSVIDTLKGEVQQLAKDLFNFAAFCKTQSQKISQGKKADDLPIKDFVVLIGVISSSL
ncbi:MAG: hypothetical protein FK734_12165 [Asgard group archaeon]|nr:hypothetical protein [Asgard group archaeon]